MKKLFTLLTLLVFLGGGKSWGTDIVVFSMTDITNGKTSADNGVVTSITATYVNGSAEVKNNHADNKEVITKNGEVNLGGSGNNYFHVTLTGTGDEVIKAGDVLEFSNPGTLFVSTTASDTKPSSEALTFPYTVPAESALIGATNLYFYKSGLSKFTSFTITRYSNVLKPEFSVEEGEFASTFNLTISCGTAGASIQYSLNGGTTWNEYSAPITVSETTTVMAKATKAGLADSDIASATYTKVVVTEVFDGAGLTNEEIILSKANVTSLANGYLSCNATNWSDKKWSAPYDGYFLDTKTDRIITLKLKNTTAFEVYVNGSKDRTYTVKVGSADAVSYSLPTGSGFESSGAIATGTMGEVTIEISNSTSNSVFPAFVKINPTVSIPVSTTGWSTYSSSYALDFGNAEDGIEAYAVTGFEGTTLTTSKITGTVAANTGLLVKGTASTSYNVPVVATGDAAAGNKLVAVITATTVGEAAGTDVNYVLVNNGGSAEFQWIGTTSANVGANKAYLSLSGGPKTGAGSRGLAIDIDIDGVSTGIKNMKVGSEDNVYYDLQGRRVLYPTKGLYIVNGKKVIVK